MAAGRGVGYVVAERCWRGFPLVLERTGSVIAVGITGLTSEQVRLWALETYRLLHLILSCSETRHMGLDVIDASVSALVYSPPIRDRSTHPSESGFPDNGFEDALVVGFSKTQLRPCCRQRRPEGRLACRGMRIVIRTHMLVRRPRICFFPCGLKTSEAEMDCQYLQWRWHICHPLKLSIKPLPLARLAFHSQFVHALAPLFGPLSDPSPFPLALPAPSSVRILLSPSSFIAACLTSCCGFTCWYCCCCCWCGV